MGVNIAVILQRDGAWHPSLGKVSGDGYGYALCETLYSFTQPLKRKGLQSLEEFVWEDPEDLELWIEGMEASGIDATSDRQRLDQLQHQRDWHSPAAGLASVQGALEILAAAATRQRSDAHLSPPQSIAPNDQFEELQYDLSTIASHLQLAQTHGVQFRLQILD